MRDQWGMSNVLKGKLGEKQRANLVQPILYVETATAMQDDYNRQGEKFKLGNTNPREIFAYCKKTLPKSEELFRVQMR
jgi:hypothetical protein